MISLLQMIKSKIVYFTDFLLKLVKVKSVSKNCESPFPLWKLLDFEQISVKVNLKNYH